MFPEQPRPAPGRGCSSSGGRHHGRHHRHGHLLGVIAVFVAVFVLGILGIMLLPFITSWSWISLARSERKLARAGRDHARALQQRA